jgi:hypothetical protein
MNNFFLFKLNILFNLKYLFREKHYFAFPGIKIYDYKLNNLFKWRS